jgi:hypothetical protein
VRTRRAKTVFAAISKSAFIARLSAILLLTVAPLRSFGQDGLDLPKEATLTAEQWQRRVQDARWRSEEFIANARVQGPNSAFPDEHQKEATDRAEVHGPRDERPDVATRGHRRHGQWICGFRRPQRSAPDGGFQAGLRSSKMKIAAIR